MKTLKLLHDSNFAILNDEFANEILQNDLFAFIFIFKETNNGSTKIILRKVNIAFTQQTQCACVSMQNGDCVFETLCPENQQILYWLDLPHDKSHIFKIKKQKNSEYQLCK